MYGVWDQQLGSTSPASDVMVSNVGGTLLAISAVQLTGSDAGTFAETRRGQENGDH